MSYRDQRGDPYGGLPDDLAATLRDRGWRPPGEEPEHTPRRERNRRSLGDMWRAFIGLRLFAWIAAWLRKRRIDNIVYTWLVLPVVGFLIYWIGTLVAWLSWGKQQEWQRWWKVTLWERYMFPQGIDGITDLPRAIWHATGWFWPIIIALLVISMLVWHGMRPDDQHTSRLREGLFHTFMVLALLFSSYQFVASLWEDDKDAGRFNSFSTTYVVANKTAEQLTKQFEGVEPGDGKPCLYVSGRGGKTADGKTIHDTPSCIVEGDLKFHWDDRIGSASGAKIVLGRSGGGVSNTYLMEPTLTYLHGEKAGDGVWSGLKDGKSGQSVYSVVFMDRNNNVDSCQFTGNYKIKQSFSGSWSHNLRGLLASRYPQFEFNDNNVWAFCVPGTREPVIVLLPTQFAANNSRSMLEPAGVITVRGSSSGRPVFKHYETVGEDRRVDDLVLPGPVYPPTIAATQREDTKWTAGRKNKNKSNFGFDPVPEDDEFQGGNNTELLRRAINPDGSLGDLYWVTSLTPRHNDARTYVAHSATKAGTVNRGKFNEQRVLVFNDKDPRDPTKVNPDIVNLDSMSSRIRDEVGNAKPGYFNSGGKIVEFVPRVNTLWLAYGEIGGRVKYRFEIATTESIKPTIVDMDTGEIIAGPKARIGNEVCYTPGQMSTQQAGLCLKAIGDELATRKGIESTVPTPTASATAPPR